MEDPRKQHHQAAAELDDLIKPVIDHLTQVSTFLENSGLVLHPDLDYAGFAHKARLVAVLKQIRSTRDQLDTALQAISTYGMNNNVLSKKVTADIVGIHQATAARWAKGDTDN